MAEAIPPPGGESGAERSALSAATAGKGYGPQSPRDIDQLGGGNPQVFAFAPDAAQMTLCNVHLHESAEHKGGEFTVSAGKGDQAGFKYNGSLTPAELAPVDRKIGDSKNGDLVPGDTIEIHFVYSTAQAIPGPGLNSCFTDATHNPQLRVEAVVGVLVNDPNAVDFSRIARIQTIGGLHQAPDLPEDLGTPIVYLGSTTGSTYNEKGSPIHVTWSVRPEVEKIDIHSLGVWLEDNPFDEDHAHRARTLVTDPELLSQID